MKFRLLGCFLLSIVFPEHCPFCDALSPHGEPCENCADVLALCRESPAVCAFLRFGMKERCGSPFCISSSMAGEIMLRTSAGKSQRNYGSGWRSAIAFLFRYRFPVIGCANAVTISRFCWHAPQQRNSEFHVWSFWKK